MSLFSKKDADTAVLNKIGKMPEPFRAMGEKLHALIMKTAPSLQPKLWYGLIGYAKDGEVICFFSKNDKYLSFGLSEHAHHAVDEGATDQLMGSAWFFTTLDDATEAKLIEIVRKATR